LGRWWSVDPADEFNSPYVYVGNRPIITVDPDGADSEVRVTGEGQKATGYKNREAYDFTAYKLEVYNDTEYPLNKMLDSFWGREPDAVFWVGRDAWKGFENKSVIEGQGFLLMSRGEKGGQNKWMIVSPTIEYNDKFTAIGPKGETTWYGESFHSGYPKNSLGCITFGYN